MRDVSMPKIRDISGSELAEASDSELLALIDPEQHPEATWMTRALAKRELERRLIESALTKETR